MLGNILLFLLIATIIGGALAKLIADKKKGELGSFRVLRLQTTADQKFTAVAGDSYINLVEFANRPRAQALVVYGNASQPDSPHNGDQLPLYSANQLRPVWRSPAEIKAHLEKREVL